MPDGDVTNHQIERPRVSRAARAVPTNKMPENVPGFSLLALGKQLGLTRQREHLLQIRHHALTMGDDTKREDNLFASRMAKNAIDAAEQHADALEAVILTGRAVSTADAICQILIVSAYIDTIADGESITSDYHKRLVRMVNLALASALRVLGQEHQPLAEIGGQYYAAAWLNPRPVVEIDPLTDDCRDNNKDRCIDGSVGDWA